MDTPATKVSTTYQELKDMYNNDGHFVFVMALAMLLGNGRERLQKMYDPRFIASEQFKPDMAFMTEELARKTVIDARKMADAELDVLMAVVQREMPDFIDASGKRIPSLHPNGDEEGICPICGAEIEYGGDQEIVDDTTEVSWSCPSCGATGTEVNDIVFNYHCNVHDKDNNQLRDETGNPVDDG